MRPEDFIQVLKEINNLSKRVGALEARESVITRTPTESVINENGEDIDTRIEGDTDTDLVFVDAGTDRVGIGTNAPQSELHVDGLIRQEGAFAHIYTVSAAAAQAIPNAAWTKITGFANNGQQSNCTAAAGSDKISVTVPGRYLVVWDCGGFTTIAADNIRFAIYVNSAITVHRTIVRSMASGYRTQFSINGIIDVTTSAWDVEVYAYQSTGGAIDFTPVHMGLSVLYVGET